MPSNYIENHNLSHWGRCEINLESDEKSASRPGLEPLLGIACMFGESQ